MAKVLPKVPVDTRSAAELRMRDVFERLPNKWRILHSVSWQSPVGRRQADGEADFVLIHPNHGAIILEVKGGGIGIADGAWTSTDRHGETHSIKDPFEQAKRSKHALLRFLNDRIGPISFPVEHAVALPDVDALPIGPAAPIAITWDRAVRDDPNEVVGRTIDHYGMTASMSHRDVENVVGLLLPTADLRPPLYAEIQDAEAALEELTGTQIRVLDGLRRHRRALVYGSAGTGKTVLATHKASQLAEHGFNVLLLCFNRPLADLIAQEVGDNDRVTVRSFHQLCREESRAAGLQHDGDGPGWWDVQLPGQLNEAAVANGTTFDALVVDEGQDFDADWWVSLQMLLTEPDDGGFYVFADAEQSIYRSTWEKPFDAIEFELTTNCRNTLPIASLVAGVFGHEVDSLGAGGPDAAFTTVARRGEIREMVRKTLYRRINEDKIPASEIAVISPSKRIIDALRERKLGNLRLDERGRGDVVAETVHRFKGLEASAVLLLLPPGEDVDDRLLYIGMSRARAHLEVIGDEPTCTRIRDR